MAYLNPVFDTFQDDLFTPCWGLQIALAISVGFKEFRDHLFGEGASKIDSEIFSDISFLLIALEAGNCLDCLLSAYVKFR